MPGDQDLLELLDACLNHIDEQEKMISRLTAIAKRQAEDIEQLKAIAGCDDLRPPEPD